MGVLPKLLEAQLDTTPIREPAQKIIRAEHHQTFGSSLDALPHHVVRTSTPLRSLILHYHLFKNAGTSVDELLRQNFGANWQAREFNGNRRENASAVAEFIRSNPHLQAISSHTALFPVPRIEGISVFPVIFVRHPIDRLRSVYEFERGQNVNTAGARLAQTHDFAGYIGALLQNPRHRQIRNFQTFRLSHGERSKKDSELDRAIAVIERLPFVGLVERFNESLLALKAKLSPVLPSFRVQSVHRNASVSREGTLAERLEKVAVTLGEQLYRDIYAANNDDLTLYELVNTRMTADDAD